MADEQNTFDDNYDLSDIDFSEFGGPAATNPKIESFDEYDLSDVDFSAFMDEPEPEEEPPGFVSNTGRAAIESGAQVVGDLGQFVAGTTEDILQKLDKAYGGGDGKIATLGSIFGDDEELPIGATTEIEALKRGAKYLQDFDAGYEPRYTFQRLKDDKSLMNLIGYSAETGIESLPQMIAAVKQLPAFVASRIQNIAETRTENKEKQKTELIDRLEAAPSAIASALFERIGGKAVLSGMSVDSLRSLGKEVGTAALTEGFTEFGQELIEYTGETVGTKKDFSLAEGVERGVAGAISGGPFGGAVRGVSGSIELATQKPTATDTEVSDLIENAPDIDTAIKIAEDIAGEGTIDSTPIVAETPTIDEDSNLAEAPEIVNQLPDTISPKGATFASEQDAVAAKQDRLSKYEGSMKAEMETFQPVERIPGQWILERTNGEVLTDTQTPATEDRRQDVTTRKRVEDMTLEEARVELLIDPLTGLGNKRAYDEALEKGESGVFHTSGDEYYIIHEGQQASVDADSLKWINDNMSPEAGDSMLTQIGKALNDAWDGQNIEASLDNAQKAMDEITIEVDKPNGNKVILNGLNITYGLGKDRGLADDQLKKEKLAREERGERAGRGEQPAGVTIVEPGRSDKTGSDPKGRQDKPNTGERETSVPLTQGDIKPKSGTYANKDAAYRALKQKKRNKNLTEEQLDNLADYRPFKTDGGYVLRHVDKLPKLVRQQSDKTKPTGATKRTGVTTPELKAAIKDLNKSPEFNLRESHLSQVYTEPKTESDKKVRQLIEGALGKKVVFFETSDKALNGISGFVRPQDPNTIYVNVNADRPHLKVMGHELMHAMRTDNPKLYDDTVKALTPLVENSKAYKAWINAKQEAAGARPLTDDAAFEEMVADLLGDSMGDSTFWTEVEGKSPKLYKRILDAIQEFLSKYIKSLNTKELKGTGYFKDYIKARSEVAKAVKAYKETGVTKPTKAETKSFEAEKAEVLEIQLSESEIELFDVLYNNRGDALEYKKVAPNVEFYVKWGEGEPSTGKLVGPWDELVAVADEYNQELTRRFDNKIRSQLKKNPETKSVKFSRDDDLLSQLVEESTPDKPKRSTWLSGDAERTLRRKYGFKIDNPGGKWLDNKQAEASRDIVSASDVFTSQGRGLYGSTTGWFSNGTMLDLPVDTLAKLEGVMGEHLVRNEAYDGKLGPILESMRKVGFDKSNPISVIVNHKGQAFISEGNHRLAAAQELGLANIPVELRYQNGGELASGPLSPRNLAQILEGDSRLAKSDVKFSRDETSDRIPVEEATGVKAQIETMQRKIVDLYQPIRKVQKAIEGTGENLSDAINIDQALTRFPGSTRAELDDFMTQQGNAFIDLYHKSGLTWEQAAKYLHARHAKEANAVLKARNPELENNEALSGMSDADADVILNKYADRPDVKAIGLMNDRMTKTHIAYQVKEGLLSKGEAEAWIKNSKHYIPLHREMPDGANGPSTGQGFDVRGKASKIRAGSDLEVDYSTMLARIISQHEASIIRASKNRVAKTFYDLAKEYPDATLWETDVEKFPKTVANLLSSGEVSRTVNLQDHNIVSHKVNGENVYMYLNQKNPVANRMAESLRKSNQAVSAGWVNHFARLNRYLSQMVTSLSPEFVISNFFRDVQTAAYNLSDTEMEGFTKQIIKDVPNSMKGIRNALRGDGSTTDAALFDQFRRDGGMTGWMDATENLEDRMKQIQRDIDGWQVKGKKVPGKKQVESVFEFIDNYNTIVENGVRFSAYKQAIKPKSEGGAGLSRAKAAKLAKELTVDFNRKGEWGTVINSFYMFFNASVQGSARLLRAGLNPKNKKLHAMMGATVAASAMLDMVNRLTNDDDEYNKLITEQGSRSLIVTDWTGATENGYIKVPLPWGYNVLHVMGQEISAALAYKMGINPSYAKGESAARMFMDVSSAFNPVQEGSIIQTFSPTFLDPLARIEENVDWHGGPLYPNFSPSAPNYTKFYATARQESKDISKWLYEATVDDDTREAWIDVSPEWLDMGWDFLTGGLGRFVADTQGVARAVITGDSLEMKEVPLARKVVGTMGPSSKKSNFYDKMYSIVNMDVELERIKQDDSMDAYREARSKVDPKRLQLIGAAKSARRAVNKHKKRIRALEKAGKKEQARKVEKLMLKRMDMYNKLYQKKMYGKEDFTD